MSTWKAVFVIGFVFAVIFVICALAIWIEKKYPGEKYDERQKQARGNAYRLTVICGMVYHILAAVVCGMEDVSGDIWFMLIMYGVIGEAMILHVYCFLTHAAMPLDERPVFTMIAWLIMGVVYVLQYVIRPVPAGAGLIGYAQLVAGCCFLLLSAMHLISYIRQKRE